MSADTGPGGLGQAANFGSTFSEWYVDVAGMPYPGDGPFTLSTWFKTSDTTPLLTAIHGGGDYTEDAVSIGLYQGQPWGWLDEPDSDPRVNSLVHSSNVANGLWHYMALTFTGHTDDTLKLFVDGRLAGIRDQEAGTLDIIGWRVAAKYGDGNYFAGSLDDVRMYDRAISDGGVSVVGQRAGGDIGALYALGIPEPGTLALLAIAALTLLLWRRPKP